MIYQTFHDIKLSALGLGCMRLPVIGGEDTQIDQTAVNEMVAYAMEHGVNYYDTAWGYHGGTSECSIGAALSAYPRDRFYLADKFPGYDLANLEHIAEIFETQLKKCQVDYFDFYLFHNVCEMNVDAYLDPKYGLLDYLLEQKRKGRIRHLGFSCHGAMPVLKRFLEAYGTHMEFCQLQLNYIDWNFQNGKEKVELLEAYNIPVWVMEPLRGGRLAHLNEQESAVLHGLCPQRSVPAWAFRFLQTIPSVTVILSGMSNLEQLTDNISTFATEQPLSDAEQAKILTLGEEMTNPKSLACTACRYCTTHCPQQLDIPRLLSLYNEHRFTDGGFIAPMALSAIPPERQPSACIGCRSCEAVCPQQLKISEAMADFAAML